MGYSVSGSAIAHTETRGPVRVPGRLDTGRWGLRQSNVNEDGQSLERIGSSAEPHHFLAATT